MSPMIETIPLVRVEEDGLLFFVSSNYGELLLDTGAASSQLLESEETAALEVVKEQVSNGVIGSMKQSYIQIDQLLVGGLKQEQLTVSLSKQVGLLGMDFMQHYVLRFSLRQDQMLIIPSFDEGHPLTLGRKYHSFLPCELAGEQVWGLFDTGASVTIIDEAFAKTHPSHFTTGSLEIGKDVTGATVDSESVVIDSLVMEGRFFEPHAGALADLSFINQQSEIKIALILGTSSIVQYDWEFDYIQKVWRFSPN